MTNAVLMKMVAFLSAIYIDCKNNKDLLNSSLTFSFIILLSVPVKIWHIKSHVMSAQLNIFQRIRQFVIVSRSIAIVRNSLYYKELSGINVSGTRVVNCLGNQKIKGAIIL
jgi:hypothetical protein